MQQEQELCCGVFCAFPLLPPWAPSQQCPHLPQWHSSTVCGLGPGPPTVKGWCWLSWGTWDLHPWILVTVPLICRHHMAVDHIWCLWAVFHQAFLQHVQPSPIVLTTPLLKQLAFQPGKGPQCWEPSLTRWSSGSVSDVVEVGQSGLMSLIQTPCLTSVQQSWYDNSHVYLALGGQPDVLWLDVIFQLTKGKAGYSGSWFNLQIQRSQWWHYAAQVTELNDWIEMSVINKDSWFYIAWARSPLIQNFHLFQANSQSKVFSCTGKMASDLL